MAMARARVYVVALWVAGCWMLVAEAQEANFGKKVKCYIEAGTVVCPGCNYRAGLSCPRNNNMQGCGIEQPEFPITTEQPATTQNYEDETNPTTSKVTDHFNSTTDNNIPIPQEEIEYWAKLARENEEFRRFLYKILHYRRPIAPRWKRQVQDDTCTWNGDCPCPLICCKQGDGCPKRCVKGIRLPPPFG